MSHPPTSSRPPGWYRSGATRRTALPPAGPLADSAWSIVSTLLAGIAIYSGLGWLASMWLGNRPLLVAGGALLGLGLAFYIIVKRLSVETPERQADRAVRRREDVPRVS